MRRAENKYLRKLIWCAVYLLLASSVQSQVLLYSGGEFDFESGFYRWDTALSGRGYEDVGRGWGVFHQPAVWLPPSDQWGVPGLNENGFWPNVSSGNRSQEITFTDCNGDVVLTRTVHVTAGRLIRFEFDAITHPTGDPLQLRSAAGQGGALNFSVGVDLFEVGLDWDLWERANTESQFGTHTTTIVAQSNQVTYYFWARHYWASAHGGTMCCDNLRVYDDGLPPNTPTPTHTPTPTSTFPPPTNTVTPLPPSPTVTPTACAPHTADQNGNGQLDYNLVLLVIQRFNLGGEYHCGSDPDGYAPGEGVQTCAPHASDYDSDWKFSYYEMLRLIQFFHQGYHCQPGTVDGYAPND